MTTVYAIDVPELVSLVATNSRLRLELLMALEMLAGKDRVGLLMDPELATLRQIFVVPDKVEEQALMDRVDRVYNDLQTMGRLLANGQHYAGSLRVYLGSAIPGHLTLNGNSSSTKTTDILDFMGHVASKCCTRSFTLSSNATGPQVLTEIKRHFGEALWLADHVYLVDSFAFSKELHLNAIPPKWGDTIRQLVVAMATERPAGTARMKFTVATKCPRRQFYRGTNIMPPTPAEVRSAFGTVPVPSGIMLPEVRVVRFRGSICPALGGGRTGPVSFPHDRFLALQPFSISWNCGRGFDWVNPSREVLLALFNYPSSLRAVIARSSTAVIGKSTGDIYDSFYLVP